MKLSSTWYALILIASALLLSGVRSASADPPKPTPRATADSHRKAASEQKPTADHPEQALTDSEQAGALSSTTPDRGAKGNGTASGDRHGAEEERHDRREEALEQSLVCLTAILAGIEVLTLVIFVFTMFANIKAANAAKVGADAAKQSADSTKSSADAVVSQMRLLTRPKIEVSADTLIPENTTVTVHFTAVNAGHTDARVVRQRFALWTHDTHSPWPSEIPSSGRVVHDVLLPEKFAAYDWRSSQLNMTLSITNAPHPTSEWNLFSSSNLEVCISARILYSDESEKNHETLFCRAWSRSERKFLVPDTMPVSYNRST